MNKTYTDMKIEQIIKNNNVVFDLKNSKLLGGTKSIIKNY